MAQARIRNFEKVYHYLNEEVLYMILTRLFIIDLQKEWMICIWLKRLLFRPLLVKEAKNDLDEMLKII